MKNTKKKTKKRKNSFLLTLGAFALVGYFAITLIQLQIEISERKQVLSDVQSQYSQKLEENKELAKVIEGGNEDEYIERIARDSLGYVKPGEKVYYDISFGS